ncbi:hypothetical protein F5Y16DRAFT_394460 [Xylariaceae sp. FL0255]|nr:hypothetical protein F5Y16DRAFT_394460 [Xylariaceae sp. FL0255]
MATMVETLTNESYQAPTANEPELHDQTESGTEFAADALSILQNQELLQLVRTTQGANQVVSSFAESALGHTNWGVLLGAAPDALGRLGQCFVLASDPLAASLVFSNHNALGLKYDSLRANLMHCADLGRAAFHKAENSMRSASMLAQSVCEVGGTIDMVVEAVEDPDLVELDLPDQLANLKEISTSCVEGIKAVKTKFDTWAEFVRAIHVASVAQDDQLEKDKRELNDEIIVHDITKQKKLDLVNKTEVETEEYRRQLDDRQVDFRKAQRAQHRGPYVDVGRALATIITTTAKIYTDPMSVLELIGKAFEPKVQNEVPTFAADQKDPLHHRDIGYALAQSLQGYLYYLQAALTCSTALPEYHGVDWDGLSGRAQPERSIVYITNGFQGLASQFAKEQTPVAKQVRVLVRPGEKVAATIRAIIRSDGNVQQDTMSLIAKMAEAWRSDVKDSLNAVSAVIEQGYNDVDREEAEKLKVKEEQISTRRPSSAELRFRYLLHAQRGLFDAERRLRKRMEEEMKAAEDFNAMELQLKKMLMDKANMKQVKEIVGDCVKHLQYFCENLNELLQFFATMQTMIANMDQVRVDQFAQKARTTKKLADRGKQAASTEQERQLRSQKEEARLEILRLRALELKGHYLVAQAMADTYAEISTRYILPGIKTIERLGLPEAKKMTKEERAMKISEVGQTARKAKDDVASLANTRRKQIWAAVTVNRGEIKDIED